MRPAGVLRMVSAAEKGQPKIRLGPGPSFSYLRARIHLRPAVGARRVVSVCVSFLSALRLRKVWLDCSSSVLLCAVGMIGMLATGVPWCSVCRGSASLVFAVSSASPLEILELK